MIKPTISADTASWRSSGECGSDNHPRPNYRLEESNLWGGNYDPSGEAVFQMFPMEKQAGDFNGNGKQSLINSTYREYNTGLGFCFGWKCERYIFRSKNVVDVDKDGIDDWVTYNQGLFKYYISSQNHQERSFRLFDNTVHKNVFGRISFNNKIKENIFNFYGVVDQNSDGRTDLIVGKYNEHKSIQVSKPYAQDKIISIKEKGLSYTVSYKPATDPGVHTQKHYYEYPVVNTTPTRYLVNHVVKKPYNYDETTYDYVYEGAKSHLKGMGFLGFDKVTVTEKSAVTTTTESYFNQQDTENKIDLEKAGEPYKIVVYKNDNKIKESNFCMKRKNLQA